MGKTATSNNYICNHFPDTTLVCSLIVQKQESREMPLRNWTGLIQNSPKGRYVKLISFVERMYVLKKTTVNRYHEVYQ